MDKVNGTSSSQGFVKLARRLGFNDAKAKMLIGQWAGNLAGLSESS